MKLLDVLTSPWAIIPDRLFEIQAIYATHLRGEKIDIKAIEAALGRPLNNEQKPYQVDTGVALIGIEGVIAKKASLMTQISGGISTQKVKADLRAALADPEVSSILLVIDSPGGSVDGTEELAAEIYASRGQKPICAFTDGMIASAAYWIASAADSIWISGETPWIGSIGVVTSHVDYSGWEQKNGIKTTEIYAGRYKRIASETAPLSSEGKDYLQAKVDVIYSIFVDTVARNRPGLSTGDGTEAIPWADGRIFIGQQAIEAGLVDGVSTLDDLIAEMAAGNAGVMSLRARLERDVIARNKALCSN
jgi:capsid assembly protease